MDGIHKEWQRLSSNGSRGVISTGVSDEYPKKECYQSGPAEAWREVYEEDSARHRESFGNYM